MKRGIVIDVICFLFILLFMYAGLSKLLDYKQFVLQLGQSPMLTDVAVWVAWIIPLTEILISVLLVITKFRLAGLYAAFALMVVFTGYIILILHSGVHVPCSCGGILEELGWEEHLLFNAVFVLLGLAGIFLHPGERPVLNVMISRNLKEILLVASILQASKIQI